MLLPGLNRPAISFVAVDKQHQLVIGAAASTRRFRPTPLPGPGIDLHVIEPCRRNGIGRDLLVQLGLMAHSAGAAALYAASRVEEHSEQMLGWQRLGFTPCQTIEQHRLSLAPLEPQLGSLIDRIRRRGQIPPTARIIPLYQADLRAVLQLHLDHLGGDRESLRRRLAGKGPDAFLAQFSKVLVVDDKVRGFLVGHRQGADTMVVDANIVDPEFRGGWANVWIKLESARGVLRLGIKNLEYTTFDRYEDSRSFTKKLGGVTTGISMLMHRPIEQGAMFRRGSVAGE
jgi:hypothetical protein